MIDKIEPVFRASLCDETVQQIIDLVSRRCPEALGTPAF